MKAQRIGEGFENLEDRLLLAGNIVSTLTAGDLVLDGDALANQVKLSVSSTGELIATGLTGTTIDGVSSVNFGVVNSLTIDTDAGQDSITLTSTAFTFAGDISIDGGVGNDLISVTGKFGAALDVFGGSDLDTITISRSSVTGILTVDSGDGNDKITISATAAGADVFLQSGVGNDTVQVTGSTVRADLSVEDLGGNNLLSVKNSSTRGSVFIGGELGNLGAGNDSVIMSGVTAGFRAGVTGVGNITVNLGDGGNSLNMTNCKSFGNTLGDGILITSGLGNDVISLLSCTSSDSLDIDAGAGGNRISLTKVTNVGTGVTSITTSIGQDSVTLDQVILNGTGIVDTGAEVDILKITNSRFTLDFDATTGDGNDIAYLGSNFFAARGSTLNGGLGTDAATVLSNSPFTTNVTVSFENIQFGNV